MSEIFQKGDLALRTEDPISTTTGFGTIVWGGDVSVVYADHILVRIYKEGKILFTSTERKSGYNKVTRAILRRTYEEAGLSLPPCVLGPWERIQFAISPGDTTEGEPAIIKLGMVEWTSVTPNNHGEADLINENVETILKQICYNEHQ